MGINVSGSGLKGIGLGPGDKEEKAKESTDRLPNSFPPLRALRTWREILPLRAARTEESLAKDAKDAKGERKGVQRTIESVS